MSTSVRVELLSCVWVWAGRLCGCVGVWVGVWCLPDVDLGDGGVVALSVGWGRVWVRVGREGVDGCIYLMSTSVRVELLPSALMMTVVSVRSLESATDKLSKP